MFRKKELSPLVPDLDESRVWPLVVVGAVRAREPSSRWDAGGGVTETDTVERRSGELVGVRMPSEASPDRVSLSVEGIGVSAVMAAIFYTI